MLASSAIPTIFTFIHGNPEPVPYLLGYLGLFLLGAAFLAIGLFWSALTEIRLFRRS